MSKYAASILLSFCATTAVAASNWTIVADLDLREAIHSYDKAIALEPSHALAHVMKIAPTLPADHIIVMNMCGRGDKDIFTVAKHLGFDMKV